MMVARILSDCGAARPYPEFYQYNDDRFFPVLTMSLDLKVLPLYRLSGEEQSSLPGLMAAMPPRKIARGRDGDRLIVYLLLSGNAVFSTGEYMQLASLATVSFYNTPGTLTSALRAAAESINKPLLDRNMSTSGRGQYAVGLLALAALRETQLTLLLSGPMHVFVLSASGPQRIFDSLSGKGLGLSHTPPYYFSQTTLQPNDRLLFSGKIPVSWESALNDASPASIEATRRRLVNLTTEDLNSVLLQATEGPGTLTVLRPGAEPRVPAESASSAKVPASSEALSRPRTVESVPLAPQPASSPVIIQPSAYAIAPQPAAETHPTDQSLSQSELLASLPRAKPVELPSLKDEPTPVPPEKPELRQPSRRTRQTAKFLANGIRSWRQASERINSDLQKFLPRLLPQADESSAALSSSAMIFIAILVPLVVVTMASVVYFRYGRSVQYEEYLVQAQNSRATAISLTDPSAQREAWQSELFYLDRAESYGQTSETRALRQEAQNNLDQLLGIMRLQFQPVLSNGVGVQISRLAANENNDLYMLDAQRGGVLHAALTSSGYEEDTAFNCAPGSYGSYTVGPLVDILSLPPVNSMNATVLGIDAEGNLLYCAPGQIAQAIPLPPPDTNWGRVKAFALDSGNLYVLDAQSRAVWVYAGKDSAFVDRPYFFFGGQIPDLQNAIDLAVNGNDLYILHSDSHVSSCSYSRIQTVPTRCEDPAQLVNPFPAYRDVDLFSQSHFTQMLFSPAPDSALLLLDADSQGVFRFTPRSLELQSQLRPTSGHDNPLPSGRVGAMALSPNHVLFVAVQDRVYFASDSP